MLRCSNPFVKENLKIVNDIVCQKLPRIYSGRRFGLTAVPDAERR